VGQDMASLVEELQGTPGAEEAARARFAAEPEALGPPPLLPSPAEVRQGKLAGAGAGGGGGAGTGVAAGAGAGGTSRSVGASDAGGSSGDGVDPDDVMNGVPPGMKLFRNPGPYDRRYYFDDTKPPGKIVALDPLREKPRPERPSSS
jgi:hypothetical protein